VTPLPVPLAPHAQKTPSVPVTPHAQKTPSVPVTPHAQVTPSVPVAPYAQVTPLQLPVTHSDQVDKFGSKIETLPDTNYPMSIQLESETLQKYQDRIPFRSYLENGYKKYRLWLSMTLGSNYAQHLNFCVARNINKENPYVMGLDIEVRYVLKRLENLFSVNDMKHYENVIQKTLEQNFEMSDAHVKNIVHSYLKNPKSFELTLSAAEFDKRLSQVPTIDLDRHSFKCWRNANHAVLNNTPYPITQDDIFGGEALSPPTGAHIGLQMLELNGYLPAIHGRRARTYGVTFI
jgi:hypothetical protein